MVAPSVLSSLARTSMMTGLPCNVVAASSFAIGHKGIGIVAADIAIKKKIPSAKIFAFKILLIIASPSYFFKKFHNIMDNSSI
jgi:hypothetical protein